MGLAPAASTNQKRSHASEGRSITHYAEERVFLKVPCDRLRPKSKSAAMQQPHWHDNIVVACCLTLSHVLLQTIHGLTGCRHCSPPAAEARIPKSPLQQPRSELQSPQIPLKHVSAGPSVLHSSHVQSLKLPRILKRAPMHELDQKREQASDDSVRQRGTAIITITELSEDLHIMMYIQFWLDLSLNDSW